MSVFPNGVLKPLEDMYFVDAKSLYNKIDYIKIKYILLDRDYREIYKWFFFKQLCLLKDYKDNPIKSNLWGYVVGKIDRNILDLSYNEWERHREYIVNINREKRLKRK